MPQNPIRVLLIEDQETDYLLTRRMLASCTNQVFDLKWADSWQAGIEAIRHCAHDVCLLDFRIGGGDGIELLKESGDVGCRAPVILLTGIADYRLDVLAMEFGAADFLVKDKITPELLERSIRYAMAQAQAVEELRRRQDELSRSELRFRSVVHSAADAIILADGSGKIQFWNNGAQTIFGYTEEEIIGAPIECLMPEPYRLKHRAGFERFQATHKAKIVGKTVEFEGLKKDGTVFPIELSLASWTNREGTTFTAIIRDMSERRSVEQTRWAKETAEEASHAKSAFVARMNHELRTPLRAIIGCTNLLLQNRSGTLTHQEIDSLERILLNAKDQIEIMNSVVDLSKMESGKMELRAELICVDSVVRDVVKQLEVERRSEVVRIVVNMPPVAKPLRTDPRKLKQVLMNIVENALKFTESGTVTIELKVDPVTMDVARIDVIDTGVGMPPDQINEIFMPFRQLATQPMRGTRGSGLGLSICRSLCDLMGYQLRVQSEPGRGSTFSILFSAVHRLPLSA